MELLFSVKTGSFPLYAPGVAYGHSASALTLGQIFHPLSHLASIMPGYWNGRAVEWNNLYKMLSLGLTQIVLFAFLQKLRLSRLFSLLLSFIAIYNLKLLDIYRHGTPLEAYTGHFILCAVIGWYFINPTKWTGPLCIICASYLLICSGHPEEMYYGFVGAGLFTFVAPFYLSTMLPDKKVDYRIVIGFLIRVALYLCIGILLSSAYILPFYFDFISDNIQRVDRNYAEANINLDTFVGTLNNFFLPLRSVVYGAFGASSLLLMAFILPVLRFFKIKIPRSVWLIWGVLMIIFLYIQGSRTPVHRLVWEYLPFASSIRDPGRISIMLPFFIMLVLAWVVVQSETVSLRFRQSVVTLRPVTILAFCSLSLIIIYYLSYIAVYYSSPQALFQKFFSHPAGHLGDIPYFRIELLTIIMGISLLICLAFYSMRDTSGRIGLLLTVLVFVQAGIVLQYRAAFWTETKYASPSFMEMQRQKEARLDYRYYPGYGLQSSIVNKQLTNSFMEPFLGKIFTQVIPVNSQEEAYGKMRERQLPQQVFIEGYPLKKAGQITDGARHMKKGTVKLVYSSFNRLRFHVSSGKPAIMGLSYPNTGKWRAWINGERVHVYRANGAAHAVEIPEGESIVEFRYWSRAFLWGMGISCVTFAITGLFVAFRALKGPPRYIWAVIVFIISAGAFSLWYNSLYSGDNLNTEYTWSYSPPAESPNLAYGKKNWLSSCLIYQSLTAREHELSRGRLVDGDSSPGSGFTTRLCDDPAWFLDLFRLEEIKTIILYNSDQNSKLVRAPLNTAEDIGLSFVQSGRGTSVSGSPLKIELSRDGEEWSAVASSELLPDRDVPARIIFKRPPTARYIRISASGRTQLAFDEVEVYGPADRENSPRGLI
ncbi:MAG: YfhO family protein [Nitrospirae bacterium]|nr:YfhO family protein [Nitrospirota bacterium]